MKFFGRKTQNPKDELTFGEPLAETQVAPGTQLGYDSHLLARLCSDRAALAELAATARNAAQSLKFDDARRATGQFRTLLNEHMLEKTLRLYTYLSCCLRAEPEALELMRNMRWDMSDISRKFTRFMQRCEGAALAEESRLAFMEDLMQIADVLSRCLACEEKALHPMYQPPHVYAEKFRGCTPANDGSDSCPTRDELHASQQVESVGAADPVLDPAGPTSNTSALCAAA